MLQLLPASTKVLETKGIIINHLAWDLFCNYRELSQQFFFNAIHIQNSITLALIPHFSFVNKHNIQIILFFSFLFFSSIFSPKHRKFEKMSRKLTSHSRGSAPSFFSRSAVNAKIHKNKNKSKIAEKKIREKDNKKQCRKKQTKIIIIITTTNRGLFWTIQAWKWHESDPVLEIVIQNQYRNN